MTRIRNLVGTQFDWRIGNRHTATSSQAGIFDSKLIEPDKSWILIVRTKGDFDYVCTYHPTMKATLRVE